MPKIQLTIRLETDSYAIINQIAEQSFRGNLNACIDYVFRQFSIKRYYRFMAQQHQQQLMHFSERLEDLEKNDKQVTTEL